MKRLAITLIHNNDPERSNYIGPLLSKLQSSLTGRFDVRIGQIGYQPEIVPQSIMVGIYRDYLYWRLGRQWSRYKSVPDRWFLVSISHFLKGLVSTYVVNPENGRKWLRCCSIELVLSEKHIRSLYSALEMSPDYYLCLEDDVVFLPDSIQRLSDLLAEVDVFEGSRDTPLYVDLAGGCNLSDLRIDNLEIRGPSGFRAYRLPVTNTACCYLLNRVQMEKFAFWLGRYPLLRMIGADWMMNKLLMLQCDAGIVGRCLHADPTMFQHGSVSGVYTSSIRGS